MRISTVIAIFRGIFRRLRSSPLALLSIVLFSGYIIYAYHYIFIREREYWSRWYWNYAVSFHPILAWILPMANWTPTSGTPRYVEEIYQAPWMGTFELANLTKPVYIKSDYSKRPHGYISPAIVKIDVYSTPSMDAYAKRELIRKLNPLATIPREYRHLIQIRFVFGYKLGEDGLPDPELEKVFEEEERVHKDVWRLKGLKNGENLREGKILDWIKAVGKGEDGGREAWWLFKMDDDLDARKAIYYGQSLNRFPLYHFHFTGMLTGFTMPLFKTLAAGIEKMPRDEIERSWDDDVLTGELMFCLPSGPWCQPGHPRYNKKKCDVHAKPFWGYYPPPQSPSYRTGLIWHDVLRRMGDPQLSWLKLDIAQHPSKWLSEYEDNYKKRVGNMVWKPSKWLKPYAEDFDS